MRSRALPVDYVLTRRGAVRFAHLLATLLSFALAPVHAAASSRADRKITIADLNAQEKDLFDDVRDDKLDRFDAVTAALVASSASAKDKEKALKKWKEFLAQLELETAPLSLRMRAEYLLSRLHGDLLGERYDFDQNDMTVTLLEGGFNCVTSALAYQAAAKKLGLDVRGVLVPTHVYVRVVIGEASFDVETTSPRGFLLAKDDDAYRKFLTDMQLDNEKRMGRKIVTDGEKFFRREVDPIGLLALIYANRGASAVRTGKTKAAIGDFARSSLLAQDERYARDSRDLLLAQSAESAILEGDFAEARRLLEFAIADPGGDPVITKRLKENVSYCWSLEASRFLEKNDYSAALGALANAAKWSDDPAIPHNQRATYGLWGLQELEAKRYARAAEVFQQAHTVFPSDKDFTQNYKATYFEWVKTQLEAKDYRGALATARALRAALPDDSDSSNLMASTAATCADERIDAGDWNGATAILDEAARLADTPSLRHKLSATWTNAGVAFIKAGDEKKAEAAWKKALEIDPTSVAAKTNLENLRRR